MKKHASKRTGIGILIRIPGRTRDRINKLLAELEIPQKIVSAVIRRRVILDELAIDEGVWTNRWTYPNRQAAARVAAVVFRRRPRLEAFELIYRRRSSIVAETFKNANAASAWAKYRATGGAA